jgi:hypothetical protein
MIFRPDFDEMWLVAGADKIKLLHATQYGSSKKAKKFVDLKDDADVAIKVRSAWPDSALEDYLIPKPDPTNNEHGDIAKVTDAIRALAKKIKQDQAYVAGLSRLMEWTRPR